MKQNAVKKIPAIITGIIYSIKNSNTTITFNFLNKKNRRSSQMAGAEKQCKFKTNLSKQVTNLFSRTLESFLLV